MEKSTASTIVEEVAYTEPIRSSLHTVNPTVPDNADEQTVEGETADLQKSTSTSGMQFWLVMLSLMVSTFLSALDLVRT